mmetsp:Transcript_217/g.666  ORF Transcript_217/g.666 Transcript_217/m.666 type:complete len:217 (+) Transcript_217:175-825(+)
MVDGQQTTWLPGHDWSTAGKAAAVQSPVRRVVVVTPVVGRVWLAASLPVVSVHLFARMLAVAHKVVTVGDAVVASVQQHLVLLHIKGNGAPVRKLLEDVVPIPCHRPELPVRCHPVDQRPEDRAHRAILRQHVSEVVTHGAGACGSRQHDELVNVRLDGPVPRQQGVVLQRLPPRCHVYHVKLPLAAMHNDVVGAVQPFHLSDNLVARRPVRRAKL